MFIYLILQDQFERYIIQKLAKPEDPERNRNPGLNMTSRYLLLPFITPIITKGWSRELAQWAFNRSLFMEQDLGAP